MVFKKKFRPHLILFGATDVWFKREWLFSVHGFRLWANYFSDYNRVQDSFIVLIWFLWRQSLKIYYTQFIQQSLAAKLNKNIDFNILSKTMKTVFGSQLPTIPLNWAWIYFQNWRFLSRINSLISLTTSSLIKLMANLALSFKYLDFFTTYPPFRVSTGRVNECRLRFVPRAHTVLFSK